MTDLNPTDPVHRLDMLSHNTWFLAYARLRWYINNAAWKDAPISDLAVVTELLDVTICAKTNLPLQLTRTCLDELGIDELMSSAGNDRPRVPELDG